VICRTWGPRRFVYTKDVVALASPDSEELVDAIPMFELEEITKMTGSDDIGQSETAQGDIIRLCHAFALCTIAGGYNSGQKYIIQARNEEECIKIINALTKSSKIAFDKFLGRTPFIKIQALPTSRCVACTYPPPCRF
jgi:hypothetical protein